MSKKTTIALFIVIVLILVIVGLGVWYFFFRSNPNSASTLTGSPFGQTPGTVAYPTSTPSTTNVQSGTNLSSVILNPLVELSSTPVAGEGIYTSKTGTTTVRYVDRGTGYIYDINLITGTRVQVSETSISPVYQAIWSPTGLSVILRYLASDDMTIKSYSATLNAPSFSASTTPGALMGSFLPDDVDNVAYSPAGSKILYINPSGSREEGVTANPDGTKKLQIFDSPTTEWAISWPGSAVTAFTTKPSSVAPGFLYFVDASSGARTKILGGINGLSDLVNPGATEVAYTDNSNNLSVYTVKSGQSQLMGIATLPEKCVWSEKNPGILYCAVPSSIPSGSYPDSWYQGLVSFTDSIYAINTLTGSNVLITNLSAQYGKNIDAINLELTKNEDHLIFMNKEDGSLWSLALSTSTTL